MKKRTIYVGEDVSLKSYWKLIIVFIVFAVLFTPRAQAAEVNSSMPAELVVGLDGTYTFTGWPQEIQDTIEFNAFPRIFDGKLYVAMDVLSPLFNTCPCNLSFDAIENYVMFYDGSYYYYMQKDAKEIIRLNRDSYNIERVPMELHSIIFHDEFFIPIATMLDTPFFSDTYSYTWDNENKLLTVKYSCPSEHIAKLDLAWDTEFKQILIEKGVID